MRGQVQALSQVLRPPDAPNLKTAQRSRGEFDVQRWAEGRERMFTRRERPGRPGPVHLRLAVDVSASMENRGRIAAAQQLAMTILLAAEESGVPVRMVAFGERAVPWKGPSTPLSNAANALSSVHEDLHSDTQLYSALKWLLNTELPGQGLVVVISDGELESADATGCQVLLDSVKARKFLTVPVLVDVPGPDDALVEQYIQIFGKAVCVSSDHLAGHVITFLKQARKAVPLVY